MSARASRSLSMLWNKYQHYNGSVVRCHFTMTFRVVPSLMRTMFRPRCGVPMLRPSSE